MSSRSAFIDRLIIVLRSSYGQIESPKNGDDTRSWLPPFAPLPSSSAEAVFPRPDLPPESAYFLQANRNKRSCVLLSSYNPRFVMQ